MALKDRFIDHCIVKQENTSFPESDEEVDNFMLTVHPVGNDVSETQSSHEASINGQVKNTKRKAGRPPLATSDKTESPRSWNDEETGVLIELWSNHENLYNTKLQNYFNRELRQKSLMNIQKRLLENKINASAKQIAKKLTDLKNYYGGQLRKIRKFENSSHRGNEGFVSYWKFFEKLNFLNDAFTPRKTRVFEEEEGADDVLYTERHSPPLKTTKMIVIAPQDHMKGVQQDEPALESVIPPSVIPPTITDSGADDIFGQLLISQMKMIPECDLKDELKISLQQMILRCKRQVNAIRQGHETKEGQFSSIPSMVFSISSPNGSTSSSYSEHH